MNHLHNLEIELKNRFKVINDYKLLKVIQWYENTIYCLLKWGRIFYLKEIKSLSCFTIETYVLSNLNEWDYLIPKIEESFISKQANIITEVRWKILEVITHQDAQNLWMSLKNLHTECKKIKNFPDIQDNNFLVLYNLFRNNILNEINSRKFFNEEQISILLKTLEILEKFIAKYYDSLDKIIIHWDLNSWNILFWNKVWFIDFEKSRFWHVWEDLVRLNSRVFKSNPILLKSFFQWYWIDKDEKNDLINFMNYFELFDSIADISYFLYKWYNNWYYFHINAFQRISKILQTQKL